MTCCAWTRPLRRRSEMAASARPSTGSCTRRTTLKLARCAGLQLKAPSCAMRKGGRGPAARGYPRHHQGPDCRESLRKRERAFRGLLGALPGAVYTTDAEGRVTFLSTGLPSTLGTAPGSGCANGAGPGLSSIRTAGRMADEDCPLALALREDRPIRGSRSSASDPTAHGCTLSLTPRRCTMSRGRWWVP